MSKDKHVLKKDMREEHWNIYITIYKTASQWEFDVWCRELKAGALWQARGVGWGERCKGVQQGGDICTPNADSCWCMAKIVTIL